MVKQNREVEGLKRPDRRGREVQIIRLPGRVLDGESLDLAQQERKAKVRETLNVVYRVVRKVISDTPQLLNQRRKEIKPEKLI